MKKAAVPSILVAVVLLAVAVMAEAQQRNKISRIGLLQVARLSKVAPIQSDKGCGSVDT